MAKRNRELSRQTANLLAAVTAETDELLAEVIGTPATPEAIETAAVEWNQTEQATTTETETETETEGWMDTPSIGAEKAKTGNSGRANRKTDTTRTLATIIADGEARAATGYVEPTTGKTFDRRNPFGYNPKVSQASQTYRANLMQAQRKVTFASNGGNKGTATYGVTPFHPLHQPPTGITLADFRVICGRTPSFKGIPELKGTLGNMDLDRYESEAAKRETEGNDSAE